MPELPEVETIRRDLQGLAVGKTIRDVRLVDVRVIQGFSPSGAPRRRVTEADFSAALRGRTITAVGRRGKYLLFGLSSGETLIAHLRMTGQLIWGPPPARRRAALYFEGTKDALSFCDTRRFGELWLAADWRRDPSLALLGPEPLTGDLDTGPWGRSLRSSKAKIQAALLDQRRIAGLGNIYVTEALFRSGIRPSRRCHRVRTGEIAPLLENVRAVLEEGLAHRGVSFRDYRDARGQRGRARERLHVYGRAGKPCVRCGSVLTGIKVSGRGTAYCPQCQK